MSITAPPPPQPPTPAPASTTPPARRQSARVTATVFTVVGALILGGTVVTGTISALRTASASSSEVTLTARSAGVALVNTDNSAGTLVVRFDDSATEASLEVIGSTATDWRLTRDGDTLDVRVEREWWPGGSLWSLWHDGGDSAVLTLPGELAGVDARLGLSAGTVRADGTFGRLQVNMSAGDAELSGSARELALDVSAGDIDFNLDGVDRMTVGVSAGGVSGAVTGNPPASVDIAVSAGSVDMTLPDGAYAVASDVSAGSFQNRLTSVAGSTSQVTVGVSAGDVTLRSAG
ncbi:hypothetical protein [Microbacterium sp.]|uniref:hypothetical protein n=1 Tax=Microbacterium sp. TaxID=51671 RepID=UPI003A841848